VTLHRTSRAAHAPARALALLLGALFASLLLAAAPAGAEVVKVETETGPRTIGLQPTSVALLAGQGKGVGGAPDAANFNNPAGSPVLHSVHAYVIYWDPEPQDLYNDEWQALIDRYMSDLSQASEEGGNDVFTVDTQYTDLTGNATGKTQFLGAYNDTNPYPSTPGCKDKDISEAQITCLSDAQIQEQLHVFIGEHGLQAGMGTIFFLLTPPAVGVCVDSGASSSHCAQDNEAVSPAGFCSYHSYYSDPEAGTVLYAAIPWIAGDLGGILGGPRSYMCQDGGWNIKAEEGGPLEKSETPQEPNQLPTIDPGDGTYDEGLGDLIIGQMASEEQNTITDPLLNAWQDKETLKGEEVAYENTDECRDWFLLVQGGSAKAQKHTEAGSLYNQTLGEGAFYVNDAFNLAALKLSYPGIACMPGIKLDPAFTEPPAVNSGEIVGFNGMESIITLNAAEKFTAGEEKLTYPTYTWNFGDGTPQVSGYAPGSSSENPPTTTLCEAPWLPPCAASVFHTYQYGGVYEVTLTVTDTAGHTASVTKPITVAGPPPPAPPPPAPGPGGPSSGSSGGAGGAGGSSSTTPAIPGPVATAATVSNSLKQVARSGLVVKYSVNEQVAGHFEVLLEAGVAHHLGITGRTATELPPGFPKSLVIAQALLVTTKGGHSSVRIRFSKRTAQRLRRAHSVKLTLRLIVHNATAQNPIFTKVMSSSVLHR
jgi:hypothetical protein